MRSFLIAFIAAVAVLSPGAQSAGQGHDEAAAWERIKSSGSEEQLKRFLDQFPKGQFFQEARQRYSVVAQSMLGPEVQDIRIRFPLEARRLGRTLGPSRVVTLRILVEQTGKARNVEIARSSGFDRYDTAARSAALDATYLPAIDRGTVVESHMTYDVSFGLLCNRAAGTRPDCDGGRFPQECSATVCALLLR